MSTVCHQVDICSNIISINDSVKSKCGGRSIICQFIFNSFCKKNNGILVKSLPISSSFKNKVFFKLKKLDLFIYNKKIIKKKINRIELLQNF